jgi:SpoVK/Ycf46/Vps4 family AAA+-type ATPase
MAFKTKSQLDKLNIETKRIEELIEQIESKSETVPTPLYDEDEYEDIIEEYPTNSDCYSLTFIEFAVLNEYLYDTFRKENKNLSITNYGCTDSVGRVSYGGPFTIQNGWWFQGKFAGEENEHIFQTKIYMDNRKDIITEVQVSVKEGVNTEKLYQTMKRIKNLAFNSSKYVGKCIKVKLREGSFRGIEIIDISNFSTELILNETQTKFLNHFVARVSRGGNARYLLNGEPGTGKTESIREIIRKLTPNVTFIIPDFTTSEDLTVILEACEIFESAVIIMDDIDLYLGSRDKGSYTTLLGQFLSFFDGVKKRKISLLASTNDKGLVDKAAERPGRFNMTLDYTFLTSEQIVKVCEIHLPKEYQLQEVYDVLTGTINGKKVNVTGAFIANLADNIKEMSEDEEEWVLDDTLSLIKESYKGFYMSQVERQSGIGFKVN